MGVDRVLPVCARDGDPVVPVSHEVGVADAVDLDRRERLAAPGRQRDALPARAHAPRGGAEEPVEVARAVDGADDGVEVDRLESDVALAHAAERVDDLVEGQHGADVLGLTEQQAADPGEDGAAPRAEEVVLRVDLGHARVARWHASMMRSRDRVSKCVPSRTPLACL